MVEVGSLRAMARATRSDALVLILTAATLALDLIYAVITDLAVAVVLALRAVAEQARLDQVPLKTDLSDDHSDEEHTLLAEHIVATCSSAPPMDHPADPPLGCRATRHPPSPSMRGTP